MQLMVYITLTRYGYYSIADLNQVMCSVGIIFKRMLNNQNSFVLVAWQHRTMKLKISNSEHTVKLETQTMK
jgi:hypothetical protein